MKTLLLSIFLLATFSLAWCQNPVLKDKYTSYSNGKLVGIGAYSNDTELRIVDISISDLKEMMNDYDDMSRYSTTSFYDLMRKTKELENKTQKIDELTQELDKKEREISDLNRQLDNLERRISDLERKVN